MNVLNKIQLTGSRMILLQGARKASTWIPTGNSHAINSSGWYAVDLDGTLAHHVAGSDPRYIGDPIPAMVERVKAWLAEGQEVRIFTARVADDFTGEIKRQIQAWCLEHLGAILPVTNAKDPGMIELWDDRARQVETNTGELVRKFNENHDERGRFASGGSTAFDDKSKAIQQAKNAALAFQEYPGDTGAKRVLSRLARESVPGGLLEEFHPGNVTVYRAGSHTLLGASYSRSRVIAEGHLVVGQTKDKVRELRITRDMPALDIQALTRGSRLSAHEKEVFVLNPSLVGHKKVFKAKLHRPLELIQAQANMEQAIAKFLGKTADRLAAKVRGYSKITKASDHDVAALLKKLGIDWSPLLIEIEPYMDEIAGLGGVQALEGLGITDTDIISAVNESAADWAAQRAAEMVGMKRLSNGTLIENPNAKWAISETTRDDIAELVTNAFESRTTMSELASAIQEAGTFSASRAKMIAQTEGARAQMEGNKTGWKESGVVKSLQWLLSNAHDHDDICDELADGGPYPLDEDLPDCPAHPNCLCVLAVAELNE